MAKPKGNSKAKRLVLGSLNEPKSRLFRIDAAIKLISRKSKYGEVVKKHVEDIEPRACGNQRQYSKAAFDILEYLKRITAVTSKNKRIVIYKLVSKGHEIPLPLFRQVSFDELLVEESKCETIFTIAHKSEEWFDGQGF